MNNPYSNKYKPFGQIPLVNRQWPNNTISKAPTWCSVDLRDGNQALITPMNLDEKVRLFKLLVGMGFKEIEVGFPSAAKVEFDFLRTLIDGHLIPDDVKVQVLTQAREHLIKDTLASLNGSKQSIVHLYNSTSVAQRKIVFQKSKDEIKEIAVQGVKWVKQYKKECDSDITLEYSPESFTGTEVEFAKEICEAVIEEWGGNDKVIINLPSTVELCMPNVYADMIEWVSTHIKYRDRIILSVHTHNDRGTGVASSELAMLAGAQRVEGTLFGNGERTGNVDIVNLALNLLTQGVDPHLKLDHLPEIQRVSEEVTRIPVHCRHPYAGELVFTAFSGSHQDAIKKGFSHQSDKQDPFWEVPYLPIDPTDIGRTYEAIIRINSQSGKGGIAYIMEQEFGCALPKAMHPEFGKVVQSIADKTGKEVDSATIWNAFVSEYLDRKSPIDLITYDIKTIHQRNALITLTVNLNGVERTLEGEGNGPIDAARNALSQLSDFPFKVMSYHEHSLESGAEAKAIAYIQIQREDGKTFFGVGIDHSITAASILALLSSLNRAS